MTDWDRWWKKVKGNNAFGWSWVIYIYIYIYIHCHPQTDCFVLSELFSVARHVGCSKPGLKPSDRSANKRTTLANGIFKVSVCLYFYTLSATRVLNSFEELCIMQVATENSFPRVLNHHGGAYSAPPAKSKFRKMLVKNANKLINSWNEYVTTTNPKRRTFKSKKA